MADIKNKRVNIYIDQSSAEDALQKLQTKADGFNNKIQKCREEQEKLTEKIKKSAEEQTKLTKQIEKGAKAGEDVTKLQKKYDSLANSIEKDSDKIKTLTTTINANNKSLQTNAAAQQKVAEQIKSGIAPSFNQLSRYVSSLHNELKNMSSDMPGYAEKFAAFQKSSQQLHSLRDAMNGVEKAQKGMSIGSLSAGVIIGNLASSAIQSVIGGVKSFVSLNAEFEKSAANLSAITGATGNDLDYLKNEAIKLSTEGATSAVDFIEALKLVASAKPELLENKEALVSVTKAANLLAQASGIDLPTASKNLTDALNQFGAPAQDAAKFVDALAAASKYGAAEVPQVTEALLQFGAQAKASNISIYESTGAIELLAEKGIKGAEAGTKLRNIFLALNAVDGLDKKALDSLTQAGVNTNKLKDSTLSLEERLKELGKISGNSAALVNVFGKENFNAAQIVLQNIPRYAELTEKINEQGVAAKQASINTDTLQNAWQKFKNTLSAIFTTGDTSFLKDLLKGITALIEPTKSATDKFKDQLTSLVNLKTSIEPLLPRYDELASKTNKSTAEQKEMESIVGKVAAIMPSAVTQVDAYGKAIAISTDRVNEFVKAETARLKFLNKDAIKELDAQLKEAEYKLNFLKRDSDLADKNKYQVYAGGQSGLMTKASEKDIQDLRDNYAKQVELVQGIKAQLKTMNGDVINDQIATNKKLAAEREAERKRLEEEAKKEQAKLNADKLKQDSISKAKEIADKKKKEEEDALKELERLRAEMKKIEDELGMVAFSEYEKGLAQINEKYMQLFEQLQKNKKATIDDFERISKDRNTAIDQYNQKQLQAAQDFIEKRKQLFASDAAKTQLDKDIDAINDYYKKEIELHKGQTEKIAQLERERGQKLADIKAKYEYEKEVAETNRIFDEKKIQFKGQTQSLIQLEEERARELAQLKGKFNTGGFGNKPASGDISSIGANDSEQTEAEKKFSYNINQWKNYAGQVFDIMSTLNASVERKEQALLNKELKANDEKKKSIQKLANSKTITEIEARRRIAEVDAQSEKKKETLERQQFERSRKMQIAQAIINGAMAITSTLAARPGPLDVLSLGAFRAINIGLAVASTAAQIAAISSTKYGKGGLFNGPLHSEGGMPVVNPATGQKVAELEGGEPILSRNTYANNRAIIDALLHSSTKENGKTISLPSWQHKPYQAINFNGITQSIQQLKFANGGVFNGGAAQANDMTPFIAVMENNQQMLFALMKRLEQPIKVDAKSVISLKQIDDAYTDRNNVKNEAGF